MEIFILGGIKTESYIQNTNHKKSRFFNKFFIKDVANAVDFILKKIYQNNNEIIIYPKIYFFLNKIKSIKKIFIQWLDELV